VLADDDSIPIAPITPGTTGGVVTLANGNTLRIFDLRSLENAPVMFRVDSTGIDYRTPDNCPQTARLRTNTLHTQQGMECRITLSDGTHVHLNAESSLTYPICFSGDRREVQIKGEAYFDVAHDEAHPFIVHAPHFSVKVTGTSFNVRAYSNEPTESTTLVEGAVTVEQQEGKKFTLIPGQHFSYDNATGSDLVSNVPVQLYTAWKSGSFIFMNAPLKEVFSYLAKWYNLHYTFDDEKAGEVCIGAHLNRYQNMNQIIDMIQGLNLVDISQRGKTLHIRSL
jgi:ferric-dicitrate binding protein FerR (iron transport regulator)